ncbi:MAG: hypothetical protein NWR72_06160, partial [Bacteroidia bacterium]|nr:hypothetical protein [Bacteroidia bacterium]
DNPDEGFRECYPLCRDSPAEIPTIPRWAIRFVGILPAGNPYGPEVLSTVRLGYDTPHQGF